MYRVKDTSINYRYFVGEQLHAVEEGGAEDGRQAPTGQQGNPRPQLLADQHNTVIQC